MNKLYFAKFLPIEGEIKEGDYAKTEYGVGKVNRPKSGDIYIYYENQHGEGVNVLLSVHKEKPQKVQLFLCTRDIQVGDKVFYQGYGEPIDSAINLENWSYPTIMEDLHHSPSGPYECRTNKGYGPKRNYFKVIGEISKDAIWVKEGDEFAEEEIKRDVLVKDTFDNDYTHYYPKGNENFVVKGSTEKFIQEYSIKIKCPCCNTFK